VTDFELTDEGSIVLLRPVTDAAAEWVAENVAPDFPRWCGALACSAHEIDGMVGLIWDEGLLAEGWGRGR